MSLRLPWIFLAVAAASSTALAEPELRDHRAEASGTESAPVVRDHRDGAPVVIETTHYRRRPGPRFMLPLKIDIGWVGTDTAHGFAPGIGAAIGVHWASLSPTPTDTDVGIGVFGALATSPDDPAMTTSTGLSYGGAYLEVGHTLAQNSFSRVWAAGRGEYLASSAFDHSHDGFGVMGRLSGELYVGGIGIEPRGMFLGTYAIGLYVEAGARDMVADVGKLQIGAGVTFRTPFVFGS